MWNNVDGIMKATVLYMIYKLTEELQFELSSLVSGLGAKPGGMVSRSARCAM